MAQTWNDVLNYIKINLGVPLNKLEISDDDIVNNLRDQVLPLFSQFAPMKKYKAISDNNLIISTDGQPLYQYRIPLDAEEYIIDILNVYFSNESTAVSVVAPLISTPNEVIDTLIQNSYLDILKSLQAVNTWDFIPPDKLLFDFSIGYGIIEYNTVHDDLSTIDPDKYHIMFKKLCLANVKIWLSSIRSKYENLTTPFGPINLNWEKLDADGKQEKEEVMVLLNMLPPDFLIHVCV